MFEILNLVYLLSVKYTSANFCISLITSNDFKMLLPNILAEPRGCFLSLAYSFQALTPLLEINIKKNRRYQIRRGLH